MKKKHYLHFIMVSHWFYPVRRKIRSTLVNDAMGCNGAVMQKSFGSGIHSACSAGGSMEEHAK